MITKGYKNIGRILTSKKRAILHDIDQKQAFLPDIVNILTSTGKNA